jgi:hypothetical protein
MNVIAFFEENLHARATLLQHNRKIIQVFS